MSKIFTKSYKRELALINIQYWSIGELEEFPRQTAPGIYFDPLFYQSSNGITDIYYEENVVDKMCDKFVDYIKNNPKKLLKAVDEYKKNCELLRELSKTKQISAIEQKFKLLYNIWPVIVFGVVLGSYKHSNDLQGFLELAKHLRSNYDDVEYEAGSVILELADEKLNVSQDIVNLLTYEEVVSGNIPSNSEINKRKKGGVFYQNKYYPGVGLQQFEKDMGMVVKKETIKEVRELKGQTVYKGKVSGKVRIVLTWDEVENFQEGEILVTSMTTPDFLPVMKKAGAIVTDEGGVTCHAAIVSREMKKPCIIGTKVATQVLKDGDEVEVDAERGVVRIIKRK